MACDISYEELSAFSAGDVPEPRLAALEQHVGGCEQCRRRLGALGRTDEVLGILARQPVPEPAVQRALDAVGQQLQSAAPVMTLREVAAFLRVAVEDVEQMIDELPAFELGGQIRVRRARLLEWIEQRERTYQVNRMQSQAVRLTRRVWQQKGIAS